MLLLLLEIEFDAYLDKALKSIGYGVLDHIQDDLHQSLFVPKNIGWQFITKDVFFKGSFRSL